MPNSITIRSHKFSSQAEAKEYTYSLRDKYAHQEEGVTDPEDFEFLKELYTKYCEYDNWETPGKPINFFSRYIRRGKGAAGGTTVGFVVRFDDKDRTELEFSAQKAIQLVAHVQKRMAL
ncbi:hypothetical protein P3W53_12965 [Pseudomonas denitrificans (nom. rej.)]|nr:hypothetical protein [Pseudomonas denitrificans (nom. rej.)]